jgi:hypothetical protein
MTALCAMEFCCDMGFVNIESEGDSLQVIKGLCKPYFSVCKWSHCCREANEVAHLLARKASSHCLSHVWVEDLPLFIYSSSFRDLLASRL